MSGCSTLRMSPCGSRWRPRNPTGRGRWALCPWAIFRSRLFGRRSRACPFADEAVALVERAWAPGETMGSAFATLIREIFAPWGMLVIDPLAPAIRAMAAPFMKNAVERMPELCDALMARSKELEARGYHAQVLVDSKTSLVFLLEEGHRVALRRTAEGVTSGSHKWTLDELAGQAEHLSPNALLRPVLQDYLLPTAAYAGGPAEIAYLAQSQVLYKALLGRQPVAFPRAGFTLIDERSAKRMAKYKLAPTDLMVRSQVLKEHVADELIPPALRGRLETTKTAVAKALDLLSEDLQRFDVSLNAALRTSRRKIEYQVGKIGRKTAAQMLAKDEQASRDAASLHGLVFPEDHLQERLYSFIPLIAKFGPDLVERVYEHVRVECPDHQFAVA